MKSTFEIFKAELMAELRLIDSSTSVAYRTHVLDVRDDELPLSQCSKFPTLLVLFDAEKTVAVDSNLTVFDSTVPVMVIGYIDRDADDAGVKTFKDSGEMLIQDIKKVIVGICKRHYARDPNYSRWKIDLKKYPIIASRPFAYLNNRSEIAVSFTAEILSQPSTFIGLE